MSGPISTPRRVTLSWENNSCDVAAQIAASLHRRNASAHQASSSSVIYSTPPMLLQVYPDREPMTVHVTAAVETKATVVLDEDRITVIEAEVSKTTPPAFADNLGFFLLAPDRQDEVLGDLKERFDKRWLPALGLFGANCCYVWHVIRVSTTLRWIAAIASVLGYFKFRE